MHGDDLPEGHLDIDVSARRERFGIGRVPRSLRRCRRRSGTIMSVTTKATILRSAVLGAGTSSSAGEEGASGMCVRGA
jgi:hypothetical protein